MDVAYQRGDDDDDDVDCNSPTVTQIDKHLCRRRPRRLMVSGTDKDSLLLWANPLSRSALIINKASLHRIRSSGNATAQAKCNHGNIEERKIQSNIVFTFQCLTQTIASLAAFCLRFNV